MVHGSRLLNFHRVIMSQTTSTISNFTPAAAASDLARMQFIVSNMMNGMRTAMAVQVMAVTNNGGVSPIGCVDVQPAVSSKAGDGTVQPHGIIHNVPYMRIQGGTNAVIIDPQVGDIGIAIVCDRDISTVKSSQAISAPGSSRKYDMSDMVYLMTIIGKQTPTQYVQFSGDGINIVSPSVKTSANFSAGNGSTGVFTTPTGQTITVQNGIITNIA